MLTSHQSRRLPQPGKAPPQACKCKQSRASDKREWKSHTQPAKPVTKPRIKTRRIEKDSHRALPLIPGGQARTILRPQPAPTLSSLVSTLPIAPNTIAIAHLTRRSPKHTGPLPPGWLAWAWGHMRASWRGTWLATQGAGRIHIPRGHVPGSFVGWRVACVTARPFGRAMHAARSTYQLQPPGICVST